MQQGGNKHLLKQWKYLPWICLLKNNLKQTKKTLKTLIRVSKSIPQYEENTEVRQLNAYIRPTLLKTDNLSLQKCILEAYSRWVNVKHANHLSFVLMTYSALEV